MTWGWTLSGDSTQEYLSGLALRLERVIADGQLRHVSRVVVVRETGSTQDLAARFGAGAVVIAGHQTSGRGRLGRGWEDADSKGVALTLAAPADAFEPDLLSMAAGVAAARTVEAALRHAADGLPGLRNWEEGGIGLRWPNDVVERVSATSGRSGRKCAGVLVERREGLALIGIGLNVSQREADWGEALRTRAVSVRQLGSAWEREDVAARLVVELDGVLRLDRGVLSSAWRARDVLVGSRRSFVCDNQTHTGIVEDIDPAHHILLRGDDGKGISLPALTTSMVHE